MAGPYGGRSLEKKGTDMRRALSRISLAVSAVLVARLAHATASPLQVVIDGREEAKTSRLTETGLRGMFQDGTNLFLIGCGLVGILMVGAALYMRYQQEAAHGGQVQRGNWWIMFVAGSLLTIVAVVAAVLPYAILG